MQDTFLSILRIGPFLAGNQQELRVFAGPMGRNDPVDGP